MIKRLVPIAAMIGSGHLCDGLRAAMPHGREKRVALVVGNATYQTVPQLPTRRGTRTRSPRCSRKPASDGRDPAQRRQSRVQARDPPVRGPPPMRGRHRGRLLRRPRHRDRRHQLSDPDRRQARQRPRCRRTKRSRWSGWCRRRSGAKRLRLIILDACRDNPFVAHACSANAGPRCARSSAGLGKVEPTSTDTLIAYAAKAGSTAEDGDGGHSPFTAALLKNLTVPGLDVRLAFGRVRDEVLKPTGNRQEPFVYGSLGGGNIALVPAPAGPAGGTRRRRREGRLRTGPEDRLEAGLGSVSRYAPDRLLCGSCPRADRGDQRRSTATVQLAALPQRRRRRRRETPTRETIEWDKLKETRPTSRRCSVSSSAFRIRRWPSPPSSGSMF